MYSPVGVLVVQLGVRYKSYCSSVARTYLIDPPPAVAEAYAALVAAHSAALDALRPGARCCDVHAAAAAALPEALRPFLARAVPGGGWPRRRRLLLRR